MPEPKREIFLPSVGEAQYECPKCGYKTTYHPEDDSGAIWVRCQGDKKATILCVRCVTEWISGNVKPMRRLSQKRS